MGKAFQIKTEVLGPNEKRGEQLEIRFLNRIVQWRPEGITWEADPRHAELIIQQLELQDCAAVMTPGVKHEAKKEKVGQEMSFVESFEMSGVEQSEGVECAMAYVLGRADSQTACCSVNNISGCEPLWSTEAWAPCTDERAQGLNSYHQDLQGRAPRAKPCTVSEDMCSKGWTPLDIGSFAKSYVGVRNVDIPVSGRSGRRIVRRRATGEMIDDLCFNSRTSLRRINKHFKTPEDVTVEMYIDGLDRDDDTSPEMLPKDASLFRAVVARINFLAQDRSDLQYASKECSRRMSSPRVEDWALVKRIGRYLKGRPRAISIFMWQDRTANLTAYSDSDHAGCKVSRKSTSGACFMMGKHLLKSFSRTQSNIALSSAEAELYSFVTAASEAIGLKSMLKDFGVEAEAHLQVDASAAIGIAQRKGLGKVRHLDCQALWIQDAVRRRRVHLEKVLGTENPADLMTKYLDQASMDKMLAKMGVLIVGGRAASAPQIAKQVSSVEELTSWGTCKPASWADASED